MRDLPCDVIVSKEFIAGKFKLVPSGDGPLNGSLQGVVVDQYSPVLSVTRAVAPRQATQDEKTDVIQEQEAKMLVERYKKEGQAARPSQGKRFRGSHEYTSRFPRLPGATSALRQLVKRLRPMRL